MQHAGTPLTHTPPYRMSNGSAVAASTADARAAGVDVVRAARAGAAALVTCRGHA